MTDALSVLLAEGGWRINRLDDDRFVVLDPDGWQVTKVWAIGVGAQSVEAQVEWAHRFWYDEGGSRFFVGGPMSAEGNDQGKHRTVLHADESFQDFASGQYWVVAITEDEPGFSIVSMWRTLETAKQQVVWYNENLGLTDDEVRAIRISSMRASLAAEEE